MKIKLSFFLLLTFLVGLLFLNRYNLSVHAADPVSTSQISIVGDSLTVRAKPYLQEQLPNAVIDGVVSRPWSDGLSVVSQLKSNGSLLPVLVFALGTNNSSLSSSDIDSLLNAASGSKIILVTTYNSVHPDWANNVNNTIKSAASAHSDIINVADWNAIASANPSLIDNSDGLGVHPTIPNGSQEFAKVISQAVGGAASNTPGAAGQTVLSNCVVTKIGAPGGEPQLPAGCQQSNTDRGGLPGPDQAELLKQIKTYVDSGKINFEQSNDREGMTNGSGQVLRDDGTMITINTQVLRFYVYMVNQGYSFSVLSMVGHHDKYSVSGYVSRHWDGAGIDIDAINSQDVINSGSKDVTIKFMKTINSLIGGDLVPSQLLCAGNGSVDPDIDSLSMDGKAMSPGFTTKYVGDHINHVHVGY